ncbi:MAG: chloride channel protein [Acidobacteriota bacterium]
MNATAATVEAGPLRRAGLRLSGWLDRLQPSASFVVGASAVVTGLLAAGGVWGFRQIISWSHHVSFDVMGGRLAPIGVWTVVLLPVLGGLVAGLIMHWFVGHERHHGVAGIMEAVALMGGRLRWWRLPAKALGAGLAIGAGASVGPEDPSVQIGANSGSMLGQLLRLSDDRVKTLVAAGSAAGIAAAFNAPIAGVFFALEVILGEIGGSAFSAVVIAAVTSAAATQALSGSEPAFHVPQYGFDSIIHVPLDLALGLLAGPVAAAYVKLLGVAPDWFHRLALPRWAKPAVAGGVVGIVGIWLPQLFGVGYDAIGDMLGGRTVVISVLVALVIGKLLLTPLCIGAGFPGGVFAPALFTGAALGAAFGATVAALWPGLGVVPASFALVGMAAVLAGAVHAPLTAILLLFEMTNDYHIILPVMGASVLALVVERALAKESVYTLALAKKGVRIERGRDVEVLSAIRVGEVMESQPPTLREDETVERASARLAALHRHGLAVVDAAGQLVGVLTLQDIEVAAQNGVERVSEACTHNPLIAFADESLGDALRRMSVRDIGRLPVVERSDSRRLVGLLRRADVIRAYDLALSRHARVRHRIQHLQLGERGGLDVEEMSVEAGSPSAGQPMRLVPWPAGSLVASVRRHGEVFVPRGDTRLEPGDVLMIVAEEAARDEVRRLCSAADS